MEKQIVYLSHKLRKEGFNVSIRSTQTAIEAYYLIGDNKKLLKEALKSVYVKNKYDIPKFEEIFEKHFAKKKNNGEIKNLQRYSAEMGSNMVKSNKFQFKLQKKSNGGNKLDIGSETYLNQLSGMPILQERNMDLARDGELLNKDLTKLNKFDQRVFELCQELGKKIANKRSRRIRLASSYKVDMRRTMRRNMKYGGIPLEIVNINQRPHKKEHLFLNDISGSCEWISSWFFMLMFACQLSFKHSRMFEFDNKTIETTDLLKEKYMINAFSEIRRVRMKNAMVRGTSDMYSAFNSFIEQVNLSNKSYVIILSDCRDWSGPKVDGIPASVELMRKMAILSKKVIILNPEDRLKWDVVDSCVSLYEEAGAKVYEVNSLNKLAEFVASI